MDFITLSNIFYRAFCEYSLFHTPITLKVLSKGGMEECTLLYEVQFYHIPNLDLLAKVWITK
jgi:hypothetical protein